MEIDFKDCKDLPFIVLSQGQEMRQLFNSLCADADFHPHITMEVGGFSTAWSMCHAGIGVALLPLQFLKSDLYSQNITTFTLKNCNYSRQPVVVTRRHQYVSEYAQYAITLLTSSSKK